MKIEVDGTLFSLWRERPLVGKGISIQVKRLLSGKYLTFKDANILFQDLEEEEIIKITQDYGNEVYLLVRNEILKGSGKCNRDCDKISILLNKTTYKVIPLRQVQVKECFMHTNMGSFPYLIESKDAEILKNKISE